jgi:hypothetical protein
MIIGLVGQKGAGKSVVANTLVADATDSEGTRLWTKTAFAGPLKEGLTAMFGLSEAQLHVAEYKEQIDPRYGVTPRQLMQIVGTDLMRHELVKHFPTIPNVWVTRMHEFLETSAGMNVVIEDVRFPEEVECIRKHGGKLVMVTRPSTVATAAHEHVRHEHVSESYVAALPWDALIVNSGSVTELQSKALDVARSLKTE